MSKEDDETPIGEPSTPEYSCEGCGGAIPEGMSEGLCPACLLSAGLETEAPLDQSSESSSAETLEDSGQAVGKTIDRYKLLQEIGEGGFGTVYLARQTEPVKRQVALKVIKAGMDTREVIARFEGERQALALMDHPNIAKVHDGGTAPNGRPYFVMELVKGVPITKYCAEQNLNTKARLALFKDVCAAVQHAHQKGIIHRDLKPSNILVSPHDGKPVIKVIDFGIAKAISMELTEKTVFTELGRMIGTPQYMSPEQAELNALDVDTRSDIYSLGVVLYELLTGTTPLDAKELRSAAYAEIQRMIREETPAKPSTRISSLRAQRKSTKSTLRTPTSGSSQDLDWITMRALEKDRTRRYETANALAQDIERHLREEPVLAGPPSATYRIGKFVRRNRRGLLSSAAAAVALLVGLAVAGGVWLNATLKEGERIALVEGTASTLIAQTERLMEQNAAAAYDDDSHFRQALNLVKQLENLVGLKEVGEEVRARRDRIVARVGSEERDRALILGIEESRMIWMGSGVFGESAEVGKGIAEAFGKHGSDPINQPRAETVAWIESRREAVRGRILAGMREWAAELRQEDKAPDEAGKLSAIVVSIDSDPWRQKLYRAIEENNRVALEQLASSEEVSRQEIITIIGLAQALLVADAPAKAEQLFRRAQRERPQNFWANFTLGNTLGDLLESFAASSGSPSREDGMSVQFREFNRGIKRRLEFDERVGFLRTAVAIRPEAAGAWMSLGNFLWKGGRLEEAVACIQRATVLKPDMATIHSDLGLSLRDRGKLDKAIVSYRKAIELDPDFAGAYHGLGIALGDQGKIDEAIVSHRKAIKLEPDFASAHNSLGIALKEQGKIDEAITSYRKAIELDPDMAVCHRNLSLALLMQGKFIEAVKPLRESLRLGPNPQLNPQLGAHLESMLALERKLLGFLRKDGVGHPSVKVLVQQICEANSIPDASQALVRKFWKDHREEVATALETAAVEIIRISKLTGDPSRTKTDQEALAQDLRKKLIAGADFVALSKKHSKHGVKLYNKDYESGEQGEGENLVNAAFSIKPGEISKLIENESGYIILKVVKRTPGKAKNFDDPRVKEAAKEAFLTHRRKDWEANYLKMLQKRIADEK